MQEPFGSLAGYNPPESSRLSKFILSKEERDYVEDPNEHELNDILSYYVEDPNTVSIHLADATELSVGQKITYLKDGLRSLAEVLIKEKDLKDVDTITATSWLVTEKPKLIENIGFIIDNNAEKAKAFIEDYKVRSGSGVVHDEHLDIEPSFAYMDKSKFLELYS